jgi:hypothetical protein
MKAFPNDEVNEYGQIIDKGMNLRDYFAAKALQAFNSRSDLDDVSDKSITMRCYQIADAMMKARNGYTRE